MLLEPLRIRRQQADGTVISRHVPGIAALAMLPCPASAEKITYDDHVLPILREKCLACHNPDKKEGDLDLGNYTNLMQGGGSGSVIAPGDSSGSYLYKLVTHEEEPAMPLESPKIPDEIS